MCIDNQDEFEELRNKPIEELTSEERDALARMLKEIEEELREKPDEEP